MTANQGTSPWVVSGTDTLLGLGPSFPSVTITGLANPLPVTFAQGTQVVSGTATLLGLGPSFPAVTITGSITTTPTPNTTITNWTYALPITVTGFPTTQQVSQSFGTLTVTYSQGTQVVTYTAPAFGPVPVTMSSQWPVTTTFLPVTFSNVAATILSQPIQVTQTLGGAGGIQPWVVTGLIPF